jgi:hypothetical protein
MKMKVLALFLCLVSLPVALSGQEKADTLSKAKFNNSLGVAAGFTTGYGLSYRYWPRKFGIQITFAPYENKYEAHYSFGLAFLVKVINTEKANFFLYEGNHFLFNKQKYEYNPTHNTAIYNGIGIGIEFIMLKYISFNLMGGYAGFENFDRVGFTGETGLYFRF